MRKRNIFYRLIKDETSLTEGFCNLLDYRPFRDLFLKIVRKKNKHIVASDICFKNFDTEITLQDGKGRSDLHLETEKTEYIFEIKVNKFTKPTDNQPVGYLDYLAKDDKNDRNKRLFFIIPRGYLHFDEICRKWLDKSGYTKNQIKKSNLIFWEEILSEIKKGELDRLNPFISDFIKIIESKWLKYVIIDFSKFELDLIFSETKIKDDIQMSFDLNILCLIRRSIIVNSHTIPLVSFSI